MADTSTKLVKDPDILPAPICIACHEGIYHAEQYFALALGTENSKKPIGLQIFRTGMIWHRKCLDYQKLPGCEGRDDPLEDLKLQGQRMRAAKLRKGKSSR